MTVFQTAEGSAPEGAHKPSKALTFARWTFAVIVARGLDAILSFLVAVLLANRFGASAQLDAFFIARRATTGMTDLVRELVRKIAMPYIAPAIDEGRALNWQTMPRSIVWFVVSLIVLPLLLIVFPEALTAVVAPGFAGERAELAPRLVSILAPLLPIAVITGLLLTYLQSAGIFFVGEASKALQRLIVVAVLLFFVPPLAVFGVAWTLLAGGVLAAAVLAAIAVRNYRRRLKCEPTSAPSLPRDAKAEPRGRMVAALLLFIYHQLTVTLDFAFASTLQTGAIASLEYGTRLVSLIPGLVTLSVSTVLYPEIVRVMRGSDSADKSHAIERLMRGSLFVQLPCSLLLACAAAPLVQLLFGHGGFDAEAQRGTMVATQYYALAAVFLLPTTLSMNAIYSDTAHSPLAATLVIAAFGLAVRGALLWGLVPAYGLTGLGIAVLAATAAMSIVSLTICLRRYRQIALISLARDTAVIALCGAAGAAAGFGMWGILPATDGIAGLLLELTAVTAATLLAFAGCAVLLRQCDMLKLVGMVREQLSDWRR